MARDLFLIVLLAAALADILAEDEIKRPTTAGCNKMNTAFSTKHIYTYKYTMTTSSGFVGTSPSRSGSKLTCKVILEVPRKCEVIMKFTACNLQGIESGPNGDYVDLEDDKLISQLERFPMYFQMNEGLIVKDTVAAYMGETVTALNIKRGFMSAVQFNMTDSGQPEIEITYDITDIFGTCPTKYVQDTDNKDHVTTHRNLCECNLHQIYETQYPVFSTTVRLMSGGLIQHPINERIYPFESSVTCEHSLKEKSGKEVLDSSSCEQHHYLHPTAFIDSQQIMYTAMINVSQEIQLESFEYKSQQVPDRSLNNRQIISLGFDFGDQTDDVTLADLDNAMADLKLTYTNNDVENVPSAFEKVVMTMRKCDVAILDDLMKEVFSCGQECSQVDKALQTFYLDGLNGCGTADCQIQTFDCIEQGHLGKFASSEFMYGLAMLDHVDEKVQLRMLEYCKSSESMRCWLPLGTIISKVDTTNLPDNSAMEQTVFYLTDELFKHCSSNKLEVTPRYLITAWKVLGNIGYAKAQAKFGQDEFKKMSGACFTSTIIPQSVFYVMLQEIASTSLSFGYKFIPPEVVEMLFMILTDTSRHNNIRSLAFSILSKTGDDAVIVRLLDIIKAGDNQQLIFYMLNSVKMIYENDQPDMQHVREAWRRHPDPTTFTEDSYKRYEPYTSKPLYFGHFYKLPFTEFFGGVVLVDIIYDPTAVYFSSLTVQLNYYIESVRYNVFEFTLNSHGIEQLMMILDMKPGEMSSLISSLMFATESLKEQMKAKGEFGLPEFQKYLAKKVAEIMKRVNYPKFTQLKDFDVYMDLKRQGKSYAFISLQEVIHLMQGMMSKDPGYTQKFLKNLLDTIHDDSFKAVEFMYINKVIPTIGGVPLNMTVEVSGWNRIISSLKSNLLMVMAGKTGDITIGLKQYILFNTMFRGQMHVPIGEFHSSGLKGLFKVGSERDVQMDAIWGKKEDGSRIFNVDFAPISEDHTSETLFYGRGRLFIQHDQIWDEIPQDEAVQSTYTRCMSDEFQMALGRSLCVTFNYPKVGKTTTYPYFPMSGPFDLDLVMAKLDNVNLYHVTIDYIDSEEAYGLLITNSAQGTEMNRFSKFETMYNKTNRSIIVHILSEEFGVEYKSVIDVNSRNFFEISEYLWMMEEAFLGYKFKGERDEKTNNANLNFALPGISWDWNITTSRSYTDYVKIVYTYYCSQHRPFLYLFHFSPPHAMLHDDKTVVTFTFDREQSDDSKITSISLGAMDNKINFSLTKKEFSKIFKVTYSTDSGEKTRYLSATATVSTAKDVDNIIASPVMFEIDGSDFGLDITGNMDGNIQDFVYTSDIHYDKEKAENNLSRKKRSWDDLNDRKPMRGEGLNSEDSFRQKRAAQVKLTISEPEKQLFSRMPYVPSIWDFKKWDSNLEVKGKLSMVQEPRDKYPSTQLDLTIHFKHPWNGGYRDTNVDVKMGMGQVLTFRNFKLWAGANLTATYESLDGTPVLDQNGDPQTMLVSGEVHVNRQSGELFDFGLHHSDPYLQVTYEILFDWEAATHHEPLIHVLSSETNVLIPAFNHYYEEKLSIEEGHWIHSLEFSHRLISYNLTSDITFKPAEDNVFMRQNGTLDFPLMYKGNVLTFNTVFYKPSLGGPGKPIDIELVAEVQSSDTPSTTSIYTYFVKNRQFGVKTGEKTTDDPDVTPLWAYTYELQDTTMTLALNWTTVGDERVRKMLMERAMGPGLFLKTYAAKIKNDMRLPFLRQPIYFTEMSIEDINREYVGPRLMKGAVIYNSMMANFVPHDQRKGPDGKLTPRVYHLFEMMRKFKEQEPSYAVSLLHRMNYLAVSGLSNVLLLSGSWIQNEPRFKALQDNRAGFHKITTPFVIEENRYIVYNFERRQILKHALKKLRSLTREPTEKLDSNLAVVYTQLSPTASVSVRTFGGHIYSIPGPSARSGTYLLAADTIHQRYSLLGTPNGITLISHAGSITIGINNQIFINDCSKPSVESGNVIGDNVITWERQGSEILVTTNFGLSITCDLTWSKVCFVGLLRNLRNTTIGLLGTNNNDPFEDRRGLDGHVFRDDAEYISHFCVSGCDIDDQPLTPPSEECKKTVEKECEDSMKKYKYWLYNCKASRDLRVFFLQKLCTESGGCDMEPNSPCLLLKVYWNILRRTCKVRSSIDKPVPCEGLPPVPQLPPADAYKPSLDIMIVISLSQDMNKFSSRPIEVLSSMIDSAFEVWSSLEMTRIGVIGFNGEEPRNEPFVVKKPGQEIGSFLELDHFDFETIAEEIEPTGSDNSGRTALEAIQLASELQANVGAHKVIMLIVPADETTEEYEKFEALKEELVDKHITLSVFSYFPQIERENVLMGVTYDGRGISGDGILGDNIDKPDKYYTDLVKATKGSFWDLEKLSFSWYELAVMEYIVNSKIEKDQPSCPAA